MRQIGLFNPQVFVTGETSIEKSHQSVYDLEVVVCWLNSSRMSAGFSIFTVLAISSEDLACFSLFVNFFSAEAWQRENKATKVRRWCEDIWKVRRSAIFAHEWWWGKIEQCVSPYYFCKERTWWITDSVKSSSWADFVPWNIKDPENKVTNGFSVTDVNKHGRILWFISE